MIVDAAIDPSSCTLSVVAKSASLRGENRQVNSLA